MTIIRRWDMSLADIDGEHSYQRWPDQQVIDEPWENYKPAYDEPNHKVWLHNKTGLLCAASRAQNGSWLGYVAVPENSILHGHEYPCWPRDDTPKEVDDLLYELSGHGDLVLRKKTHLYDKELPKPIYMVGFDCARYGDVTPYELRNCQHVRERAGLPSLKDVEWDDYDDYWKQYAKPFKKWVASWTAQDDPNEEWETSTYKTLKFVEAVCSKLANQLTALTDTENQ